MSATHHTVDPKFTYRDKRSGKDVVLYIGLLDAAHRAGLVYIGTEILAYPCEENNQTCIVKATATFQRGDTGPLVFNAIGDANPRNVGANIAPHFIRMAETRAKARALRDALNVGMVTVEELGADDDEQQTTPARQSRSSPQPPAQRAGASAAAPAAPPQAPGDLLTTIRDDEADPHERKRALHAYFSATTTPDGLRQAMADVIKSGLPGDDLDKAYRWHHKRLAELLEPATEPAQPAAIAG